MKDKHEVEMSVAKGSRNPKATPEQATAPLDKFNYSLKTILDNMNDGVLVAHLKTKRFIFGNKVICKMLGYTLDDIMDLGITDIHPQESLPHVEEMFNAQAKKEIWVAKDLPVRRRDGSIFYADVNAFPSTAAGKTYMIGIFRDSTERRKMQEDLQRSDEKYRLLLENANEAITVSSDGVFCYVNPKTIEIMGYSKEELLSNPFIDFIHPDDRQIAMERHIRRLRGEQLPPVYTFRVIDKRGTTKWMESNAVLITWEGKPATLNFVIDVTERKLSQEALKKLEKEYRLVVDNTYETISVVAVKHYFNHKLTEHTGYSKEELASRPFIDLIHPDDREMVLRDHEQRLRGKPFPKNTVFRVVTKDSEIKWVEAYTMMIEWEDRPALIAFAHDITERKLAQDALKESEKKYRLLVENANEAILVVSDGMFRYVNPKTLELTGYSREEMLSIPFIDFVHPDHRKMMMERHAGRLRGEPLPPVYIFKAIDKLGNTKWIEINAVLISWEDKPATLNFVNDITERKLAQEELIKSRVELLALNTQLQSVIEQERKRIAREIHDELGQNLTALKIGLSLIGNKLPKNEEPLLKDVKEMTKLIDRTNETVQRIATELRPAMLDDIGLLAAIEWYLDEFQKHTGIKVMFVTQKADIILDQEKTTALFRIFQEALTNITRHAVAKKVKVSLKEQNGKVLLKIEDDGIGIEAGKVTSSNSIGIIGMRERVHMYRGKIEIKGISGKGTTVKVSIPLKE